MLRTRRIEAAWTAFLVAVAVLGLVTSEGEPVCQGPLILRVEDSQPPQCPSPVEFLVELLPALAIAWAVGLGVILAIRGLKRSQVASRGSNS